MKDRETKRKEIIEKGLEIMYHNGYNATGVQEIVDAAGIPKGSFYNYFKSKEQFAIEAINDYSDWACSLSEEVLTDKNIPPLDRIIQLYANRIDYFINTTNFTLGCFMSNLVQEMGDVSKQISQTVEDAFERFKKPLIKCLHDSQQAGDIDSSRDVEQLCEFITNSFVGALLRMKACKNAEPLHAFQNMLVEVLLK